MHSDHLHVGFALRPFQVHTPPEHPFRWVTRDHIADLDLPRDTPVLGAYLFALVPELATALQPAGATEPGLRLALLERMERDQAVRTVPADVRETPEHRERWRAVDQANTAWVKELLADGRGFPGQSVIGADGVQACAAGQPQWFGSQFHLRPGGVLEPAPLREPARVDEFRSWVGLDSLEDYAERLARLP